MITFPAAKTPLTSTWLGPWPAEKNGYSSVNVFQATERAGGVMIYIEGPRNEIKQIAKQCKNVSVLDSVDLKGTPNAAYVQGDLLEFIEVAIGEGYLMKPLMQARKALYELLLPDVAHKNVLQLAKQRWGTANIHEAKA